MSHHVYTTDAFVIDSLHRGEANKIYILFTRDLGMIRGMAQGVRLLKSKLRFSLQDFSYASVSLVRGKDVWRITNAKVSQNLYTEFKNNKAVLTVVARIFSLLKKLIPGEEKNPELFLELSQAFDFLSSEKITDDDVRSVECIIVLKILNNLGYIGVVPELEASIHEPLSRKSLDVVTPIRKQAYKIINDSLKETQLVH